MQASMAARYGLFERREAELPQFLDAYIHRGTTIYADHIVRDTYEPSEISIFASY